MNSALHLVFGVVFLGLALIAQMTKREGPAFWGCLCCSMIWTATA